MNKLQKMIIGIAFGLCLSVLAFVFLSAQSPRTSAIQIDQKPIMNVAGVGGDFTLTNQDGNTVTKKNLIGQYTIIFFGFTYCPAICPTELQKLTEAFIGLHKSKQDKLQLMFVTVDPERDTQEIMKNYVGLFHPKWQGLRGSNEQTETIKRAYKIYSAKVPQGDSYTIDHSSFIYLMGKDGKLLRVFKGSDKADVIKKALIDIIRD
jgi:protein SCO1/2